MRGGGVCHRVGPRRAMVAPAPASATMSIRWKGAFQPSQQLPKKYYTLFLDRQDLKALLIFGKCAIHGARLIIHSSIVSEWLMHGFSCTARGIVPSRLSIFDRVKVIDRYLGKTGRPMVFGVPVHRRCELLDLDEV